MTTILKNFKRVLGIAKIYPFVFVLILILPSVWWLMGSGFYNMHDDLQVMRIFELERCFWDGQIPCRWSPDMSFGFGQPMFNYYSVTPYYFGLIYKLIFSASIIGSVKFLFLFSLVAGGIGMYLLAKEFWGYWGGVLASVLYTYAPYHAVEVYVRGALAENFALATIPFLWLYIYKVIKINNFTNKILLSLFVFVILTTHNISLLIITPFTFIWILYWLIDKGFSIQRLIRLLNCGLLGLGMASFFIFPLLFEQNLIQTQHLISEYYTYSSHFVSLKQLFLSRFWGDGGSIFGINDGMSFAVGWPHWWVLLIAIAFSLLGLRNKKIRHSSLLFLLLLLMFLVSVFMTHQKSYLIWEAIPVLRYLQFPWRFLGLVIFFASLAAGIIGKFPFYLKYGLLSLVLLLTFYFNFSYFMPVNYSRLVTDKQKFSGDSYISLQKGGVSDYLPKGVKLLPDTPEKQEPIFIQGDGVVNSFKGRTNGFSADITVIEPSKVIFPYTYFPDWKIKKNNQDIKVETDGVYDVISVDLESGENIIDAKFVDTPIRRISNYISLFSFFFLAALIIRNKIFSTSSNE